jgi:phosphoribosyl 1,2-cyclic phosphodiesterase
MNIKVLSSSSSGNATIISDGETTLLLDAGISAKNIRVLSGFAKIDGVFITHEHQDHSKAAKDLAKYGAEIYTGQGTIDALGISGHRYHAMKSLESVTVGTFNIMAFDVTHDAQEPLGFYVKSAATGESAVYFSDTAYVKYTFSGLTHILGECNHGEYELRQSVRNNVIDAALAKRILKNHMSLERFAEFLQANDLSRLKQIYLIHLSDNNSNPERIKHTIQALTGAEIYVC